MTYIGALYLSHSS